MCLTAEQSNIILAVTRELAGADASVRLFGSRLNDQLRGGDIDLLVKCTHRVDKPVRLAALITARLQRRLGDRKIDVLLIDPETDLEPVHRVARSEGQLLRA